MFFNDTTRQILRKRYAERTTHLVYDLKQAFQTERTVPLDTLILEKMVIHNMNRHRFYFYGRHQDRDKNWPYALPESVYNQILKHDVNSEETKILFEILAEQISLFTTPEINWEESEKYTDYEMEKYFYGKSLIHRTKTIQSRLIQVVEKLKEDQRYEKYHKVSTFLSETLSQGENWLSLKYGEDYPLK